jgi:hypothetical protein
MWSWMLNVVGGFVKQSDPSLGCVAAYIDGLVELIGLEFEDEEASPDVSEKSVIQPWTIVDQASCGKSKVPVFDWGQSLPR